MAYYSHEIIKYLIGNSDAELTYGDLFIRTIYPNRMMKKTPERKKELTSSDEEAEEEEKKERKEILTPESGKGKNGAKPSNEKEMQTRLLNKLTDQDFEFIRNENKDLGLIDSQFLCADYIPFHIDVIEFCEFLSKYESSILEIKVAKTSYSNHYLILLHFLNTKMANIFYNKMNGKRFNELEKDRCYLSEIVKITYTKEVKLKKESSEVDRQVEKSPKMSRETSQIEYSSDAKILFIHSENSGEETQELKCPICLDKLISEEHHFIEAQNNRITQKNNMSSSSFILSILCSHSYHWRCLQKWKDDTCPLCRFTQSPRESNVCEVCNSIQSLWMCLICGFIGCTNIDETLSTDSFDPNIIETHSKAHYIESLHVYAMNIQTKNVWDYAKEGYVHRLIQNRIDGKLIEIDDPTTIEERSTLARNEGPESFVKMLNKKSYQQKLNDLNYEYNLLLVSQLDTQRLFYDNKFEEMEKENEETIMNLEWEIEKSQKEVSQAVNEIKSEDEMLIKEKEEGLGLQKELERLLTENYKRESENKEVKKIQEEKEKALEAGKGKGRRKLEAMDERISVKENNKRINEFKELKNEIKEISFHLKTQSKVKRSKLKEEIEEGQTLLFKTTSQTNQKSKRNKHKHKHKHNK